MFIQAPANPAPELADRLVDEFSQEELTELGLGIGLFHGFSKMLIALGLEPDHMETTVLSTPAAPDAQPTPSSLRHPLAGHLVSRPDLASYWEALAARIDAFDAIDESSLHDATARLAKLIGVSQPKAARGDSDALAQDAAERFTLDVRSIDQAFRERLEAAYGRSGTVQLILSLAVYDGIYRMAATGIGSASAIEQ